MKAVILAGGRGTRMRPLTYTRPKPLLPLVDEPVLNHLLRHLAETGFHDVLLTLGNAKQSIKDQILEHDKSGLGISFVEEPDNLALGTAGSVKLAEEFLSESFLVVQGDALTNIDLKVLAKMHLDKKCDATILLCKVPDPWLYGIAVLNDDNIVQDFQEKPDPTSIGSDLASIGIYFIEPSVLSLIPKGEKFDFAKDLFPLMLSRGMKIQGIVVQDYWIDIGSFEGYLNGTKWHLRRILNRKGQGSFISRNAATQKVSIKEPVWIEDGVKIGAKSEIGPYAIVKRGCTIGRDSIVRDSVLLENSVLNETVRVSHSIIGELTVIERGVEIDGAIIGPGCYVKEDSHISGGTRTSPNMVVLKDDHISRIFDPDLERAFYFHDPDGMYTGQMARNPRDLIEVLPEVNTKSLNLHRKRGDLIKWVNRSLSNERLSDRITEISTLDVEDFRREFIEILSKTT
ncbi:MAG: sugar phosphate nucleotidyltransferase [Thaumarchaeota archaeon]|nr:sugar phosphate nucleotidyltransferase [Nitrososphaerota archaeon]